MDNDIDLNGFDGIFLTIYSAMLGVNATKVLCSTSKLNERIDFIILVLILVFSGICVSGIRRYLTRVIKRTFVLEFFALLFITIFIALLLIRNNGNTEVFNFIELYGFLLLLWGIISAILSYIGGRKNRVGEEHD